MALCSACGQPVEERAKFCSWCGKPVELTVQPVAQQPAARRASESNWFVVLVIVSLFVFVVCVIALSSWKEEREKAKQSEIVSKKTAAKVEEAKRREDVFRGMSPAEHLGRMKSLLTFNATPESYDEALKHLAAIPPNTPEASAAAGIKRQYEVEKRRQAEEAARAQAIAEKKKAMQDAADAKKRGIEGYDKRRQALELAGDDKRRQALALAFEEVMRQQGHEVSVGATSDELWFDCSSALEPRSSCYAAYQSSKHLPSDVKTELRAVGITTLNFSPNGGMIPTWATSIK